MPETLNLEIVTPEGAVNSERVARCGGQINSHHVSLMTQMTPGEIIGFKDEHETYLATGAGLIDVTGDGVSVLTDLAVAADRIDEPNAEEARRRAEARLREKLSDEEVVSVNASLARSLAQLHVTRRHHK